MSKVEAKRLLLEMSEKYLTGDKISEKNKEFLKELMKILKKYDAISIDEKFSLNEKSSSVFKEAAATEIKEATSDFYIKKGQERFTSDVLVENTKTEEKVSIRYYPGPVVRDIVNNPSDERKIPHLNKKDNKTEYVFSTREFKSELTLAVEARRERQLKEYLKNQERILSSHEFKNEL